MRIPALFLLVNPLLQQTKLITSRRYIEAIDVLHTTNLFHLSGTISKPAHEFVLLRHLPDVLPLLAQNIQRVRLTWSFWVEVAYREPASETRGPGGLPMFPQSPTKLDTVAFQQFLDLIPKNLPNLKALHLSVKTVYPYTQAAYDTRSNFERSKKAEGDIFVPVDNLFRQMRLRGRQQKLDEFYLGVPFTIFSHRLGAGGPKGLWLDPTAQERARQMEEEAGTARLADMYRHATLKEDPYLGQRVWRRLPKVASLTDEKEKEKEEVVVDPNLDGYWIVQSEDDYEHIMYCFGSGPIIDHSQYPAPHLLDPDLRWQ